MSIELNTQVVVLGSGPAGYSAAFRCADLGLQTILVERYKNLGGVCLNVGCIPSKALLHIAKIIEQANSLKEHGLNFDKPCIDINKISLWKDKIIEQLNIGLFSMAKARKIKIVKGLGKFCDPNNLIVIDDHDVRTNINFDNAIIASGSSSVKSSFIEHQDSRIWSSTSALNLIAVPKRMLIIGGGVIGMEMGSIYHALGSKIEIVEMFEQIIPLADKDIVDLFSNVMSKKFKLMLKTKVKNITPKKEGIYVTIEGEQAPLEPQCYDCILVATGRIPNSSDLDLHKAGIKIDGNGFITVDKQMRTNISNIYAIGDVVGQPMLAHKGMHQGHIAAEVISGLKHYFDPKVIPLVAYTDPELAWVGITEKEAIKKGLNYETSIFPWSASGRAIASDCTNGITKLIFDKDNNRIIGGAIVGSSCGEILGEIALAIEMGCDAEDIALTIHSHPTLNESIGLAAQLYKGSITDLPNHKAKKINF